MYTFFSSLIARLHIHVACKYVLGLVCVSVCLYVLLFACFIYTICVHLAWQNVPCWIEFCCICTIFHHYITCMRLCVCVLFDYRLQLRVHVHLNCQLQQKPKLDHSLASSFVHFNSFLFPQSHRAFVTVIALCIMLYTHLLPFIDLRTQFNVHITQVSHLIFSLSHTNSLAHTRNAAEI